MLPNYERNESSQTQELTLKKYLILPYNSLEKQVLKENQYSFSIIYFSKKRKIKKYIYEFASLDDSWIFF